MSKSKYLFVGTVLLGVFAFGAFSLIPQGFSTRDIFAQTSFNPTTAYQATGSSDQDDMAIWVHPTTPAQSLLIGSDKASNRVFVYNISGGAAIQTLTSVGQPGNIDIRYNFNLSGQNVDIVGFNDRSASIIQLYKVDPTTRALTRVDNGQIRTVSPNYGFALYKSPVSGKMYAFVSQDNGTTIEQYELTASGTQIGGTKVRTWQTGSGTQTEGMVADDEKRLLYASQEGNGVWKLGAEPGDATPGTIVLPAGSNGLNVDLEGTTLYKTANGNGYIIVSAQGSSSFAVFDRNAPHTPRGTFKVASTSSTDGIDVANVNLGTTFPQGAFFAHSGGAAIRGLPWNTIAQAMSLTVDTSYNPRGGGALPTQPQGVTNTPTIRVNTPTPAGTAGKHVRLFIDNVDRGAWFSTNPIPVTNLATGNHALSLRLYNGNNTYAGFQHNINITVSTTGATSTQQPNSPTPRPNSPTPAGPTATSGPQPTGVSGQFPCGKYPNANPGCMNVSYQSWFDNVAATDETMSVNYTPRLLHQHYECAVPAARANGQYIRQGMSMVCQFVRYNSIIPFSSSNSGWYRSQNQGNTYEQFTLNLPACQGTKYEGKECKSEHVHTVRSSDMSSATEMRFTPNANFVGLGGDRHFLSSNWQTGIGYRSSSEFTARYWIGQCGNYQRTILSHVDKYMTGNEPISTVRGTVTIPFETNGGCGSRFKTFVFLDPSQHVRVAGTQTGTTLMETNGHFNGNLTWDTTKTSNGVHLVLFINLEGTGSYVSASGVAIRYNVQN